MIFIPILLNRLEAEVEKLAVNWPGESCQKRDVRGEMSGKEWMDRCRTRSPARWNKKKAYFHNKLEKIAWSKTGHLYVV